MKERARSHRPVYVIRAPKPPRTPGQPRDAWRYAGAAFGLFFMLFLVLSLVWVVASGAGTGRFVFKPGTPTPAAGNDAGTAHSTASPSPFAVGTIEGTLAFPAGTLPAEKVCAEPVPGSGADAEPTPTVAPSKLCVNHPAATSAGDDATYKLTVPAGTYYVYAALTKAQGGYSTSYRAYYSVHGEHVPVTVTAGQTTSGVDPTDWNATGPGQ